MPTISPQCLRTVLRGSLSYGICGWMTTVWQRCQCIPSAICRPCRRWPWLSTKSPASRILHLLTCPAWWFCKYPPLLILYICVNLGAKAEFLWQIVMKVPHGVFSWRAGVWGIDLYGSRAGGHSFKSMKKTSSHLLLLIFFFSFPWCRTQVVRYKKISIIN